MFERAKAPGFSKCSATRRDDSKQYYEAQRLSNEILSEKSLPRKNYSQHLIKVMQEKIDFFKKNSGRNSVDYNAVSGQLTIINENQQTLYQRVDSKFDVFKEFEVSEEDVQTYHRFTGSYICFKIKKFPVQIEAKMENNRQLYNLKLHTLWSSLKKDGFIGIVGYIDRAN